MSEMFSSPSSLTRSLADLKHQCQPAQILAVSKRQSETAIRKLYADGQRHFGENYVQELLTKMENLKDLADIHWHLIGHLQKNEAKQVVGVVSLIHSVDSVELASQLDKLSEKTDQQQKILIEVNLAEETGKGGFLRQQLIQYWPLLCAFPHLRIQGLMTMPPIDENPEVSRRHFRDLKNLLTELKATTPPQHGMSELSMGTSHDFAVAIQEGATIVRLGTILFGERTAKR